MTLLMVKYSSHALYEICKGQAVKSMERCGEGIHVCFH
ncbi:Hypothetical protein DIP1521 [Corynebacterium diphtheriae]|uniref:Uncharacterized protein n=1 Tax=Corynebacterium diphtheriae (strain ATCC 700971 / NCTC 13129 / Biotype gravis) TaxID=257309 RepID=Q6NGJ2_CORDI|nr:Hypothetical protein DIP1521 [Corynebacterium diphtheriae]